MKRNNLIDLLDYGQSYWLDNLTRHKIQSGEIERRMTQEGLRGITSNPSIFNKAIAESDSYDGQVKKLVEEGRSPGQIYEILTIKDVQDACDILRKVYDESGGIDGFVSLEVSPYLAHDTKGTIDEVHRLFKEVSRANCYIKIPGTKEGIPAIEQMLYEGIPINITLLFSIERYAEIAGCYVRALQRRDDEGLPVNNVISVASFFLSRIDVLADQLLGYRILPGTGPERKNTSSPALLLGKAGIASARIAYHRFREVFSGPAWKRLADKGARVQRPLWASTGNKDPLYNDLRYVETLIGPDTVNTLPDETIDALADHGTLRKTTIEEDLENSLRVFQQLKECEIDIEDVTRQLENEGIRKFMEAYNKLLGDIARKRFDVIRAGEATMQVSAGDLKPEIPAALNSLDDKQAGRRLFAGDPSFLSIAPGKEEIIKKRLSWQDAEDAPGLQPLKKQGLDLNALIRHAKSMKGSCDPFVPAAMNPGISLGCLLGIAQRHGKAKVIFDLSDSVRPYAGWIEKLPVGNKKLMSGSAHEKIGEPENYDKDRIFVHIYLISDKSPEKEHKMQMLEKAGHVVIKIGLPSIEALGGEFYRWNVASEIAEYMAGMNS